MRITRHAMFMEIAHTVAKRSTCFRESVGCIVVDDNNIVSIGYNGVPAGEPHCHDHPHGNCKRSIHAEINALTRMPDHNDYLDGHKIKMKFADLYCTHLPCIDCRQAIIQNGMIARVFFTTIYGDPQSAYRELDAEHIQLFRILPSGAVTSYDRVELLNVKD